MPSPRLQWAATAWREKVQPSIVEQKDEGVMCCLLVFGSSRPRLRILNKAHRLQKQAKVLRRACGNRKFNERPQLGGGGGRQGKESETRRRRGNTGREGGEAFARA